MWTGVRVYIAGPYSHGDPEANTLAALQAADTLINSGYIPYVPHLTHYWHQQHPHSYEFWMEYDMEWLKQCDAVFRISGTSRGADEECRAARILRGMPVVSSIEQLDKIFTGEVK